jgi:quercetin dioxygenase-like cupin family protein
MKRQLIIGLVVGLVIGALGMHTVAAQDAEPEPVVISQKDAPKRWTPDGRAHATLLTKGQNAYVGLLEMDGGVSVPEHRDPTEEFIFVIEGSGTMHIDDRAYDVQAGDAIYMPADAKVRFRSDEGYTTKVVQVFAGPGPSKKYDNWKAQKPE